MAAIDKIYCSSKDNFIEFYNWCKKYNYLCINETGLSLLDNFYITPKNFLNKPVAIASFREAQDIWLIYHCPIEWIRNYILEEQYSNLKIDKNKIKYVY